VKQNGLTVERPTKNRRSRVVVVDHRALSLIEAQARFSRERAELTGVDIAADPYVLTLTVSGRDPWDPDMITQYSSSLRPRLGPRP